MVEIDCHVDLMGCKNRRNNRMSCVRRHAESESESRVQRPDRTVASRVCVTETHPHRIVAALYRVRGVVLRSDRNPIEVRTSDPTP